MTELETRMRAMLEKTGLYFGEDKWFSAELAAYAKGLELVYDTLSHVRRDAFVQTAEEDGLKAFESLFRVVPSVDSTKNRRAMLLTRGAVTPADHTVEAMQKQLLAAGINGKLVPQKGGVLNINVLSTMGISEAAAESEARAFFACAPQFGVRFRQKHVGRTGRGGELVECARPSKQDLERARRFMSGKEKHGSK